MRLTNRTIVVTGAARGLGNAMARAFVTEGARVVCADHDGQRLRGAVSDLAADGVTGTGTATDVAVDVRSAADVKRLVDAAQDAYGPIDVLVNNAGVQQRTAGHHRRAPVADIPVDIWDAVIETNLRGPFLCTRAVLPGMLERDAGRLIHVSSGAGTKGRPNRSPYVASKFGLEGFHESLSLELEGTGVESVTLRPPGGGIATESRSYRSPDEFAFHSTDVIARPAVCLAAGEGENGGRYVGTADGDDYVEYTRCDG